MSLVEIERKPGEEDWRGNLEKSKEWIVTVMIKKKEEVLASDKLDCLV